MPRREAPVPFHVSGLVLALKSEVSDYSTAKHASFLASLELLVCDFPELTERLEEDVKVVGQLFQCLAPYLSL